MITEVSHSDLELRLWPDGKKIGMLIRHARVPLSGIQTTDKRCVPVKPLDSRQKHAGMTTVFR
jgi:hypothetical protein